MWINVGAADAIRRQVTFNVYDADEHDANRAVKKGSIEVTRLMGDHMAEARVTQDRPDESDSHRRQHLQPGLASRQETAFRICWHR